MGNPIGLWRQTTYSALTSIPWFLGIVQKKNLSNLLVCVQFIRLQYLKNGMIGIYMAKKTYLGILLIFTIVFLLNNFFFELKLYNSYKQTALSRIMLHIQAAAMTKVDRGLKLDEFPQIAAALVQSIRDDQRLFSTTPFTNRDDSLDGGLTAFIMNSSGRIVASSGQNASDQYLPTKISNKAVAEGASVSKAEVQLIEDNDDYYLYQKHDIGENGKVTYLLLFLDSELLEPWISARLKEHEGTVLQTGAWGTLLLLLLTMLTVGKCASLKRLPFKIYLSTTVGISIPLLVILFSHTTVYQDNYISLVRENASDLASKLILSSQSKTADEIVRGRQPEDGTRTEYHSSPTSQFEYISGYPGSGESINARIDYLRSDPFSLDGYLVNRLSSDDLSLIVPLDDTQGYLGKERKISVQLSVDDILEKTWSLALNGITLFLVALLLLVELLYLLVSILQNSGRKGQSTKAPLVKYMRPAIYFFLLGIDISMAFVPLHIQNLYTPMYGLSEDLVMGLPISVEFLFVGIFILISGVWVDRRGWHEPFLVGLVLAAAGALYSWLAPDALQFILSRAIIGTGYGLTLMAAQGFIIKYSGPDGKATGLANLIAGLYAGSICGAVIGSIMAEAYGYRPVFMFGGLILLAVIVYTIVLMHEAMQRSVPKKEIKTAKGWSGRRLFRFMFDLDVVALSLFSSLPASIAIVGFLNYFTPIYLDKMSTPESTIGQVLMIYGFSLIFMGPLIGRYIDKSRSKKNFVIIGGLLGATAFLTFDASAGVSAVVLSVILLGISSSFVLSSQSTMVLNLRVTKELGEAKALGIFRSTSRVGQVVGPIVFGGIFLTSDIDQVMTYFGAAYLIAVVLLLVLVREKRQEDPVLSECHES